MASLSTLPYDILDEIFRNLSNASLASISRTNKSFHNTVEPALYEHIRMTMIIERNYHGSRYQHSSRVFQYPPVHLLLRSVWNRPELAEYIKHVEFQCQSGINHSDPVICNPIPEPVFTEQETRSLFDFLHRDFLLQKGVTKKVKKEWIRSITKPGPPNDAQVALLISQLPNLKTLSLPGKLWGDSKFMGRMFRRALHQQTPKETVERRGGPPSSDEHKLSTFRYLESIYAVSNFVDEQDFSKHNSLDVVAFLYLPSLTKLSVSWDNDYVTDRGWALRQGSIPLALAAQRPPPTKITSLDVSVLREESLAEVLSVTPHLRTFRWEFWYDHVEHPGRHSGMIDSKTLLKALSTVRDTLEDLTINACYQQPFYQPPGTESVNGLLKLRDYNKLRRLESPLMLLLGPYSTDQVKFAKILPPNVERVVINTNGFTETQKWRWEPKELIDQLKTWLCDWKAVTPHLKMVEIRWYSAWGPDALSHLESLFIKAGLQYIVHVDLIDKDDSQWWGEEWKSYKSTNETHNGFTHYAIEERFYKISNDRTFDDLHTFLLAAKYAEEDMQNLNLGDE